MKAAPQESVVVNLVFQHSVIIHTLVRVWVHREQISSPKVMSKLGLKYSPKKCREMHMR